MLVAFGPDFLNKQLSSMQAERDGSVECILYRAAMEEARGWQDIGDNRGVEIALEKAIKHQKAGKCSDIF